MSDTGETSYAHLTVIETLLMTLVAAVTNLASVPIVMKTLPQRATRFEGVMVGMSMFTSFMYHICQIYDCTLFLNELQWHRLDNVFAITCFELLILHAMGSIATEDQGLRWASFLTAVIVQEKDPWNVAYTVAPCILYFIIALFIRYVHRQSRRVHYNSNQMRKAIFPLAFGLVFFYLGLDDPNDYLRIYHGMWHVCAGCLGYYVFGSVGVVDADLKGHRDTQIQF